MSLLYYIAPIIGLTVILIGIVAALKPEQMSKNFGISVSGAALPYVMSTGIRDIFMGLTILILFCRNDWLSLGLINFCVAVVAFSDFWIVRKHGDIGASRIHLLGGISVLGYGLWLII